MSTKIAGVMVPPRPDEPDNCCMSGCVNCVWDRYRDELEDWAAASAEARRRVEVQREREASERGGPSPGEPEMPTHIASSMDDDGGGSEGLWTGMEAGKDKGNENLFEGVPIGIREFMRNEKKLKERRNKARRETGENGDLEELGTKWMKGVR